MNVMHCDRKVRQEGNSKVRKKGRGLSAEGLDPQEINVCRCPSTITPHTYNYTRVKISHHGYCDKNDQDYHYYHSIGEMCSKC